MSKPILSFMLTCQRPIQDQPSNMWSYVDVFTSYSIPADLEFEIATFAIAGRLNNVSAGKAEVFVELTSPSNQNVAKVDLSGDIQDNGDLSFTAYFNNVNLSEVGNYTYAIIVNGDKLGSTKQHYFVVNKLDAK